MNRQPQSIQIRSNRMKITSRWLVISLLLGLIFLLSACQPADSAPAETTPLKGALDWQAPPFELTDASGEIFNFPNDVSGPTIVLFWASWCPYCKALMPHLQSIVDEYEGEIQVLALNIMDDQDPREFIDSRGYRFTLLPQAEAVAKEWGVKGTPGLFLVDESGQAIFSNYAIPEDAYPKDPADLVQELKNVQKASRKAPVWAAHLRHAIDRTML